MSSDASLPEDLGRSRLAITYSRELVARLTRLGGGSSTFALVGPWGSGKSWLLSAVLEHVGRSDAWRTGSHSTVYFNPWFYADEQALFAGFSTLLLQQTLKKRRARNTTAKLLQFIGPSAKFGPVDVSDLLTRAGGAIGGLSAPESIRTAVEKGLKDSKKSVLIVMDDLDRLNPDELLVLFKLIRLVGDVPGLNYLLAYDEETLAHLLQQTAIANGSPDRARRYLEKIVERRWEVPPLTPAQVEALVLERLPLRDDEQSRSNPGIGYQLEALVGRALSTPRAAERFVSLARAVPENMRAELDQRDLYLSLFLRVAAPNLWATIVEEREFLTTGSSSVATIDRGARAKFVQARIRASVDSSSISEELVALVEDAFPAFSEALSPQQLRVQGDGPRIGNPDFVDHYLWLDLPPGAVSEELVRELMTGLPADRSKAGLNELLSSSPRLALASIRRNAGSPFVNSRALLDYFESAYGSHGVEDPFTIFSSVDDRLIGTAQEMLAHNSFAELKQIGDVSPKRPLLMEVLALFNRNGFSSYGRDFATWAEKQIWIAAEGLASVLTSRKSPRYNNQEVRRDLRMLIELNPDIARTVIRDQVDKGRWRPDDVASMYLRRDMSSSGYRLQFDFNGFRRDLEPALARRVTGKMDLLDFPQDWLKVPPDLNGDGEVSDERARRLSRFAVSRRAGELNETDSTE